MYNYRDLFQRIIIVTYSKLEARTSDRSRHWVLISASVLTTIAQGYTCVCARVSRCVYTISEGYYVK